MLKATARKGKGKGDYTEWVPIGTSGAVELRSGKVKRGYVLPPFATGDPWLAYGPGDSPVIARTTTRAEAMGAVESIARAAHVETSAPMARPKRASIGVAARVYVSHVDGGMHVACESEATCPFYDALSAAIKRDVTDSEEVNDRE